MHHCQVDHRQLFEQVYTYAPIGIALVSIDGLWMNANPALCRILGYTKEELTSLTFQEMSHPDDLVIDNRHVQNLLDGKASSYEMQKRYFQKNGNLIWTSLHVALVRDESGHPLYFISHVVDISGMRTAIDKLFEIEKLYALISENAQDIIYCMEPDGTCRYCSPSVHDQLGYTLGEVVGNSNWEYFHPDDLQQLQTEIISSQGVLLQFRLRHKNGYYLWFETTFKIVEEDGMGETLILAICREITERKTYQDNLAEAQRIASVGSWEWDMQKNEVTFSDQMFEIYGLDKQAVSNKPADLQPLVHPKDAERLLAEIEQAKRGRDLAFEIRHDRPDGTVKFLHVRGVVTFDADGNPERMRGTVQDITDRKMIELQLNETIERYTSLKRYNHDAVFSLDLEGNIRNANVVAEKLTGCRAEDMVGVNFSVFFGDGDLGRILSNSVEQQRPEQSLHQLIHKCGHRVEVLTSVAPIIINGENTGCYIIAKDITEQKKLLIAKEAAEKTNKAKTEFLAVMSHEIRTPMNGVIGMTDLLIETTDLSAEQREYAEIIRRSGESLLALINDILDFSKIESEKFELFAEPFSIRQCVAETLDMVLPIARDKSLEVRYSVSPDVPERLLGDAKRMKQVLTNLIGNAVKFTYNGQVAVDVIKTGHTLNKVTLQFTVRDTGIGIPPDKQNQLFEPFHQLDHFMTRKTEGTGLGLAITKKLVERMQGKIWLEQTEGPGATFVFTVCLTEAQPKPGGSSPSLGSKADSSSPSLSILVAEDNPTNQLVLKKMLEQFGHTVHVVENGNEVIRTVAYQSFDLIFMDVHMPEMDGLEAARIVKSTLPRAACPPIIAVTASALTGDRETCLAAGMDDYIGKPIKSEKVSNMIRKHVQKRM